MRIRVYSRGPEDTMHPHSQQSTASISPQSAVHSQQSTASSPQSQQSQAHMLTPVRRLHTQSRSNAWQAPNTTSLACPPSTARTHHELPHSHTATQPHNRCRQHVTSTVSTGAEECSQPSLPLPNSHVQADSARCALDCFQQHQPERRRVPRAGGPPLLVQCGDQQVTVHDRADHPCCFAHASLLHGAGREQWAGWWGGGGGWVGLGKSGRAEIRWSDF